MPIASGKTEARKIAAAVVFLIFGLVWPNQADAQEHEIKRRVLALFKSSEGQRDEDNPIYHHVQLPLNNLGLVVDYQDVEAPLPAIEDLKAYRGILTWFTGSGMIGAQRYREWLREAIAAGKRVVILERFGASREKGAGLTENDRSETRLTLAMLGLGSDLTTHKIRQGVFKHKDAAIYDYEAVMTPASITSLFDMHSLNPANQILLTVTEQGVESDVAMILRNGGYLGSEAFLEWDRQSIIPKWFIDPMAFFSAAYACGDLPVADLNTTGGNRTAFIHIDGDGFSTISKIDRWHICGDLVKNRILKKFQLPFSVSVITSEVDSTYLGDEMTLDVARQIFALDNVEAASHGFSHPHDWKRGKLSLDVGRPYRYDPIAETITSMNFIQDHLLSDDKEVRLFFWSGMCNPNQAEIDLIEMQGWLQLNGGAGRLDPQRPSISSFHPPYGQVGARKRINSRISNEFEFTNGWLGPYDGYKDVIQTIAFTDGERPVTPANIYFHFYILEWEEGWQSLRQVMRFTQQQPWTFVYASDYVKSVQDFIGARIFQEDKASYVVRNDGALRTLRFRNEKRSVDLSASENILGFTHTPNDLLVHLDANRSHRIVLGTTPSETPYLVSANQLVDSLSVTGEQLELFVRGFGPFKAALSGLAPEQYYAIRTYSKTERHAGPGPGTRALVGGSERRLVQSDVTGALTINTLTERSGVIELVPASTISYAFTQSKNFLFLIILAGFIWLQLKMTRAYLSLKLSRIVWNKEINLSEPTQ